MLFVNGNHREVDRGDTAGTRGVPSQLRRRVIRVFERVGVQGVVPEDAAPVTLRGDPNTREVGVLLLPGSALEEVVETVYAATKPSPIMLARVQGLDGKVIGRVHEAIISCVLRALGEAPSLLAVQP